MVYASSVSSTWLGVSRRGLCEWAALYEAACELSLRRRERVDRLRYLTDRAQGREEHPEERGRAEQRAKPERGVEAGCLCDRAAGERAELDRSPDDPAHRRVHPSLEPLGRDRLPVADLEDVVRDRTEPEEQLPRHERRERERLRSQRISEPAEREDHGGEDDRGAETELQAQPVREQRPD